jgi:predicted regulator of Ras-like GTPase activity (Roadblock/LC7/MglB family)
VNFVRRLLSQTRVRAARKSVAEDPSPRTYAALAQEYAALGMTREVERVCVEGLAAFPTSNELSGLHARARRSQLEERMTDLKRELGESPRSAVWRELVEVLIETGRLPRAEEAADDWHKHTGDAEAALALARVRVERFLADRAREQGRAALEALDAALAVLPRDPRAWRLRLLFTSRIGAFKDARRAAAQLLQLLPGHPELEARFRALDAQADRAPTIERALIEVERSGELAGGGGSGPQRTHQLDVRAILRRLVTEPGVEAALYVKSSTILVQGPRGATADRTARAVRSILSSARASSRRVGLGRLRAVQIEGDFGTLALAPGEQDAGCLWSRGRLTDAQSEVLQSLAGLDADASGEEEVQA